MGAAVKKKRDEAEIRSQLMEEFGAAGFDWQKKGGPSQEPGKKGGPRMMMRRSSVRVLMPSDDQPWVTVQKFVGERVAWFVDFDQDVPSNLIVTFAESAIFGE